MSGFLRQERSLDFDISLDPVRAELDMAFRTEEGREVHSFVYQDEIVAVICIAFCTNVPTTVKELSQLHILPSPDANDVVAIPYTVWSMKHGFGRSIVFEVIKHLQATYPCVSRVVTLSPKTEMAKRFHTANGAKHIASNTESDNYEYLL